MVVLKPHILEEMVGWKDKDKVSAVDFHTRARLAGISLGRVNKELKDIPYWRQGNTDFEDEEAMAIRKRLRWHPAVLEALEPWWKTMKRTFGEQIDDVGLPSDVYKVSRACPSACAVV
eukprot:6189680-Pleurochrysis_carterae.AAC.1